MGEAAALRFKETVEKRGPLTAVTHPQQHPQPRIGGRQSAQGLR
jgi:hypothetical protein